MNETRPSRPIRCDVWIVERMRYPTDQPTDRLTNRPTDTFSYRGALSHLKMKVKIEWERRKKRMVENKRSWGKKRKEE